MSNLKAFSTVFIALAMAVALVPAASAQTATDLQAQIASLLAQIQALQSQLAASQGSAATTAYNFTSDLTVGSKGDQVTSLQSFLESKGQLTMPAGVAKGYFGNLTKAALAAYQASVGISPAAGYFGPKTRAYVNSLAVTTTTTTTTTTPTTTTTTSGFSIALASAGNPAQGSTIPAGATGVSLLAFDVSGTGTLDSVVVKRTGLGATTDFSSSGFYLYDGSVRLTSGRSINSTTHEVSFLNLALSVSGKKSLSLVADIATSAASGNIHKFSVLSATGTPTPTGTAAGSDVIVGTQAVGTLTADDGAAPANPKVGQTNAKLAEFKLTAGTTEDIEVRRVSLTEGGSISNSNLTKLVLKQGGNTVATAAAIGAKDLATLEFTSPFLLEKGQERTFELYGDIAGMTRSDDTIVFYVDSKTDIYATGKLYGYAVTPTITDFDSTSEADTLTVQGGQVTITFNGPVTGDIVTRGQDVQLYNFTLAAQNNVEIRNLRFNVSTTGAAAVYNDFKVWDTSSNQVVTSATNVTTASSTNVTLTDVINLSAGTSKTYKVTADVDSSNSADGTVRVHLLAFQSNDIRNLDNNTYVATTSIVPSSTVSGNTMTVKAPTLDIQLAGTPASQTVVRGTANVSLAGLSFRAISDDIKLSSVRVTATSSSGTLTSAEIDTLGLYDGSTLISELKSLDSSALNATFSNLNLTIAKGVTKVLTVKGNVSKNTTNGDVVRVYLATAGTNDITAYDKDGNAATLSGTAANLVSTVTVTVSDTGSVSVARASDDTESEAGIVIAGAESALAKFRFTAVNENMTINKLQLLVSPNNSTSATSSASADEVTVVKLYDGSTQVGAAAGYSVTGSGDNSGIVYVTNLNWTVPKDSNKTLTVKGVLNTISGGADTGATVYAAVQNSGFEAQGTDTVTSIGTGAISNAKIVYKTKPTFAAPTAASSKLVVGQIPVMRFKITADSAERVSFKQIQFKVAMTGATLSAVDAVPGTTGNVKLRDISTGTDLNIASAFSSTATTTGAQSAIQGGNTGYVSLLLNTEQEIAAGATKEYELQLTFADVSGTVGAGTVIASIHRSETTLVNATSVSNARASLGTASDAAPSFVWSDNSATSHSESTSDWANGVYVKDMPSNLVTISN